MKLSSIAFLLLAAFAVSARANDSDAGTALVPNNHGGYNVVQPGAKAFSIPFFGSHGYASHVIAKSHEKPKFVLVPVIQDEGHGQKHTVYKKIYFSTAEDAETAKEQLLR